MIAIENSSYTINEADSTASITILRTQGSTGVVSVDYRTANGSAIASQDYTSVSGTLTFADGETSKTVTIPITDDAQVEGTQDFGLTIENTTGGAILGNITRSQINIQDNDDAPEEGTFGDNQYFLTSRALNWQQAQAEAQARGGNLVTINSATEQKWLEDTFGTTERYWTGLNDSASEGNFVWASGEATNYTNFLPFQPDDYRGRED